MDSEHSGHEARDEGDPSSSDAASDTTGGSAPGLTELLRAAGAPAEIETLVRDRLGQDAAAGLLADPWTLLEIPSIPPEAADALARSVGRWQSASQRAVPGDPRRGRALIRWLLARAALDGHTAMPAGALASALEHYGVAEPTGALRPLLEDGELLAISQDADEEAEEPAPATAPLLLSTERYAFAESGIAEALQRLLALAEPLEIKELDTSGLPAADATLLRELAAALSGQGVVLLSPAAGVDGTDQLLACVAALTAAGAPIALTGVGFPSTHKLTTALAARAAAAERDSDGQPPQVCDARYPLPFDELAQAGTPPAVLAVCDAHLLDVEAAARLFEAVPDGMRLLLVGDPSQPSSPHGPGRVFGDLWDTVAATESGGAASAVTCPRLRAGDREPHPITDLRFALREGELPPPPDDPTHRLVLVPARDGEDAVRRAVQLVTQSIPRGFGISGAELQVVTLRHGGPAGTTSLNAALRRALNPDQAVPLAVGDRVVTTRELDRAAPAARVPAGVLGTVVEVEGDELRLLPDGARDDEALALRREETAGLRHAWALTVHEALGGSWQAAVVVLDGHAAGSLTRALVYAACGFGTRHLSIVSSAGGALADAVRRVPDRPRRTGLPAALRHL